MHFLTLIAATLINSVWAKPVQLFAVSETPGVIDHLGLSSIHEGAGINYFQLGQYAETLEFDEEHGFIYKTQETGGGTAYNLTLSTVVNTDSYKNFPYLQLSVLEPNQYWTTVGSGDVQCLTVKNNLENTFYAAKNTSDPYRVSERAFLVGWGDSSVFQDSVTDLVPIKVVVEGV